MNTSKTIYIGTYTGNGSEGIYKTEFNNGYFSPVSLLCAIRNPKYLCRYQNRLLSLGDFNEGSGVALISEEGKILDECAFEKTGSCYVSCFGGRVYTANYHAGTISLLKLDGEHIDFVKTVLIREKAGCHQVLQYKDLILLPCLFEDKVIIFDKELDRKGAISFPQGSGPRHGVIIGKYLYLACELSNELFTVDLEELKITDRLPLLEKTHQEGTAAIRHVGNDLYISTRGADVLTYVRADKDKTYRKQIVSCQGRHPRDFIIVDGFLLCANRFSNDLVSLAINDEAYIGNKIDECRVYEAVSLLI